MIYLFILHFQAIYIIKWHKLISSFYLQTTFKETEITTKKGESTSNTEPSIEITTKNKEEIDEKTTTAVDGGGDVAKLTTVSQSLDPQTTYSSNDEQSTYGEREPNNSTQEINEEKDEQTTIETSNQNELSSSQTSSHSLSTESTSNIQFTSESANQESTSSNLTL
jgi:hypothetical protein